MKAKNVQKLVLPQDMIKIIQELNGAPLYRGMLQSEQQSLLSRFRILGNLIDAYGLADQNKGFPRDISYLFYAIKCLRNYLIYHRKYNTFEALCNTFIPEYLTKHLIELISDEPIDEMYIRQFNLEMKPFIELSLTEATVNFSEMKDESLYLLKSIFLELNLDFKYKSHFFKNLNKIFDDNFRDDYPFDWGVIQDCLEFIMLFYRKNRDGYSKKASKSLNRDEIVDIRVKALDLTKMFIKERANLIHSRGFFSIEEIQEFSAFVFLITDAVDLIEDNYDSYDKASVLISKIDQLEEQSHTQNVSRSGMQGYPNISHIPQMGFGSPYNFYNLSPPGYSYGPPIMRQEIVPGHSFTDHELKAIKEVYISGCEKMGFYEDLLLVNLNFLNIIFSLRSRMNEEYIEEIEENLETILLEKQNFEDDLLRLISEHEVELDLKQKEISELQEEILQLEQKISDSSSKLKSLQKNNGDLQNNNGQLKIENKSLSSKNKKLSSSNKQLKDNVNSLEEDLKQSEFKLDQQTAGFEEIKENHALQIENIEDKFTAEMRKQAKFYQIALFTISVVFIAYALFNPLLSEGSNPEASRIKL